ncbi:hypothetical protein V5799_016337 [Amblyomma americanum]|uniref:Nose resistant-to-fluoxetine protein N-terminal domain-containing protein n=1 Tax=Amblyomma americanum TaxID=6943 RepID=A0AAQ4F619_AMBAM
MSFWKLRPVVGGALLLYAALSCNALSASAGELHRKTGATSSMTDSLRAMVDALLDPSSPLARKLLRADMSPTCSLGLLRLVRGIRDLEPWALRIVDSSGKYPTGFLHGTSVDLGAYDECVATVVRDEYDYIQTRGQYCVLQLQLMGNDSAVEYFVPAATMVHKRASNFISYWTDPLAPGARIGICIVDRCSEEDIEALARTVLPDTLKVTVSDCVTSEYPSISPTQAGIICFLSCIAAMMFFSTLLHVYLWFKNRSAKEGQVIRLLTSFSVLRNTQYIVSLDEKSSDENSFTFMNGMRFLSIAWIILGHVYGGMTDILGIMDSFLSWKGFEPLSKLAFTVYLVHMPLYDLMNHYARERTYFSHFSLVTQFFSVLLWSYFLGYLLSISCEAPLGHIDRFLFSARRKPPQVIESKQVDEVLMEEKKHSFFVITSNGIFRRREEESKVIE